MANRNDPNHLFTLRIPGPNHRQDAMGHTLSRDPMIVIHAFDHIGSYLDESSGHSYIDVEVRQGGKVIFERGTLYCGVNAYTSTDGVEARELVMSTVAMKPGDTDEDYFRSYTAEQLVWAEENGEYLSMVREERYCDSEGNVKS